ncbi:DUF305 domain-containing protein [Clavibacter michiganensis]|uniref:DUF305 domain-containing protein n=1 Tax=Clavibacter michiganensis subsp. insidiosus TaxID=33014 RepID=A0A0D5CLN8_9MICO|nr:DUF305 domain-containing protein [Clavibacter michiganensis]AJW80177.1 hypothetical protein VO01_14590 [Clavibacter michiganensis subsp. insidiosus]AWF97149.1 DUF305 domain-containing protein [Clavibacter michiganensis subsp. insidiosus]AWG02765.1 DUF305 domain-containing protein [Clavibacter michiganensis subsp. insidiosus]OQJ58820.1 DUF305 domain-containing protein [Clavibacter michiganensis subsp. insidiosus]RII86487.1 DUF305 domain-containing protein [Clavibacter michiganensis subsp. in
MKNTTPLLRAGIALAAALTLTGCAVHDTETTPAPSASASEEATAEQVNDADEMFVQMMRPHHEQAIEVSDMLLAKTGISPEVTALATEIKEAQLPEIERLTAWADQWGIDRMSGMDHSMGGMMSDSDMQDLDAAEGSDAERLFLSQMIEHHTGAIEMAQTEIDDGQDPDASEMAEGIVATQEDEISRMRALLDS